MHVMSGKFAARASAWAAVTVVACLAGCTSVPTEDPRAAAERYQAAIASPVRTDQDRRMDASRHPAEFLPFTQVRPGMQVLDVATGGGYTTQLLALAVGTDRQGLGADTAARRDGHQAPRGSAAGQHRAGNTVVRGSGA